MDTTSAGCPGAALGTSVPQQLVRAAATLRWKRPDLTVTLAELALDAADDAATWVAAAGWLLHGRNVLGDGRQIACELLDGLARWGDAGAELMAGPQGRRLRIELAGPARRAGEQAVARSLLAADPGFEATDGELRADMLAELARCAADETPDTADAALDAAEQAWQAVGCGPGIASVLLVRAARDRRAGRADAAATAAATGLACVNASGWRSGGPDSEHLAAALTAEWIAALVDAGRLDEACSDAVPAAHRLLAARRPSRQLAGLRLAVARVAAVSESADTVLAALEPAAQDAADGDVPDLESACRSMLGELHEAAGRLDAALSAVRAAMAAERRDHDRGARLRARLAAVTATWAGRPSGQEAARYPVLTSSADVALGPAAGSSGAGGADQAAPVEVVDHGAGARDPGSVGPPIAPEPGPVSEPLRAPSDRAAQLRARTASGSGATGAGRRARRLAAEAAAGDAWSAPPLPELGRSAAERPHPEPPVSGAEMQPGTDDRTRSWFGDATAALHAAPTGPSSDDGTVGGVRTGHAPAPGTATADGPATTGTPTRTTDTRHAPAPGTATTDGPATTGTPTRTTDTGHAVAVGAGAGDGSLIGDALFRELAEDEPARPPDAWADGPRTLAPGPDPGRGPVDDPLTTNGVPGLIGRDEPPAPQGHRRTDAAADTVVFGQDSRRDLTIAPPRSARDTVDATAGQQPSRVGPGLGPEYPQSDAPDRPAGFATGPQPTPHRAPGTGPAAPPTGARPRTGGRPPGQPGDQGVRVSVDAVTPPAEQQRPGTGTVSHVGPVPNAIPDPGDTAIRSRTQAPRADAEPGAPTRNRARRRLDGPDRPSTADTDGLGIGDLLAGALAAYRGL